MEGEIRFLILGSNFLVFDLKGILFFFNYLFLIDLGVVCEIIQDFRVSFWVPGFGISRLFPGLRFFCFVHYFGFDLIRKFEEDSVGI